MGGKCPASVLYIEAVACRIDGVVDILAATMRVRCRTVTDNGIFTTKTQRTQRTTTENDIFFS
jgi:hypothetical protein